MTGVTGSVTAGTQNEHAASTRMMIKNLPHPFFLLNLFD